MTIAVVSGLVRPLLEHRLPDWLDTRFYSSIEEMHALAPEAEIGWFDMDYKPPMVEAIRLAGKLKWLNSIYAGLDHLPLDLLIERGVTLTNGVGINAVTIAEYVVMGMLTIAKGYRDVVRAQDRHEWLKDSPGKRELCGSKAMLLGYGAIGKLVAERLAAFGVEVTVVRRAPGPGTLGPDQWRARLGEFDWVILALPATAETAGMIGAAELATMKPDAVLLNVARGTLVDQAALTAALAEKRIGAALLDVTTPEPLPPEHPLWSLENAHITMHLSGRAQDKMFARSADRFIENLGRWHQGERLEPVVDLARGY